MALAANLNITIVLINHDSRAVHLYEDNLFLFNSTKYEGEDLLCISWRLLIMICGRITPSAIVLLPTRSVEGMLFIGQFDLALLIKCGLNTRTLVYQSCNNLHALE